MIFPSKNEAQELLERNNEMIMAYIELKRKYEELVSLRDEEDRIEERLKKIIENYKRG
jgi:ubiquinone biosynthesis protein UbiJ